MVDSYANSDWCILFERYSGKYASTFSESTCVSNLEIRSIYPIGWGGLGLILVPVGCGSRCLLSRSQFLVPVYLPQLPIANMEYQGRRESQVPLLVPSSAR